ncbi:uncharacterized protein LOC134247738 isoform X2 [Saccostrea cucullata]|uniref:uncharacterized protein LOC134247738 isoform X2 n=1 Tax=Saccostrea cuccullata TaxID=36930 RepID=UPI002ECFC68A
MDPLRLKSGLPTHQSYYDKLVKSGRITGKTRNTTDNIIEPNVHDDIECENPFITASVSPGLEIPSENREKIKAKNYAMRSKSLQDLKNARREIGHSQYGNGMDSEYLQNLYKKYPHTFHRRNPKDSRRPSRQMFNSGLHVHFDDEVHYNDDVCSVSSERPAITKYDREMERIFGHHRHPRSCLTSPTPSLILDSAERHCERGPRLPPKTKSYTLPSRPLHHGDLSEPLKFQRPSQSESDYGSDRIKLLELELERKEKQIQSYRRRLEFQHQTPHNTNSTLSDSSHWRVLSPDSPPDSAIDIDSSSVQSSNLGPSHLSPRNDHLPYDTGHLNPEFSPKERKYGSTGHLNQISIAGYLQQRQNGNLVQNSNKDSDVDSGIAQSLTRMTLDKGIRDLHNGTSIWDSSHLHHRPMSAMEFGQTRHAVDKFEFLKDSRISRRKDSDDDSIIQEIRHHPVMAEYQFRAVNQQEEEEEVDDSDPSFGLPTITEDDTFVREIYQQRKKPTPYKIVQRCLTARPNSAPTWKNCASESHVSVLCTPRRKEKTWKFSAVNPREEEMENVQTFKSKSESHLHGKSDARTFDRDVDQFKFNPKIEDKIRRHSRKLSQSSDSDQSETTLISSQIALNENHPIGAHFDHKDLPIAPKSPHNFNQMERMLVNDNSSARPGFREPLSKVQFRKDLKFTDLNDDVLGHTEESDTTNSGLLEPERLMPYEASVIKMDQQGLAVEDMMESDSDNVFAKPLVLNKIPKSDQREKDPRSKSPEKVTSSHVTVSRESSASVPESENTERASGSSELSAESDDNQEDGNAAPLFDEEEYDPQDPDYATVMCSADDGMNQLTLTDPVQELNEEKPDTSHHIYAKVKHVNRKTEILDSEQEKGKSSSPEADIRLHGSGTNNTESYVVEAGTKLSRKVSQSTPNVAETSTYKSNQEVPPLPDRNYGSTTNLAKSKELSGSRISLSNKMSNLRAAAKSKFKTLRKAVSLDKGINKTQGEFRPEDLSADMPPQGKPPKAKKGRSLKKLFGRKSSKHRSTEISNHGSTETSDKVAVTGHCSSIESRTSEDEVSISQLREVLPDGTQIVELNRRHKGPIGFYIARGSTQFKHGN